MAEAPDAPSRKAAFFSTASPGDTPRIETMLGYALVAAAMGYKTKIFFALDSALVTKKQVYQKLDEKVRHRLQECAESGVELDVCDASARTFHIQAEDLIEGARFTGIATFFDFADSAEITLSWG